MKTFSRKQSHNMALVFLVLALIIAAIYRLNETMVDATNSEAPM